MGGLTSALQGIGQTGNEIGTGAINAQQQSHQFLMDYLARQAQTRQLNLEQSGQEQVGKIAAGQQDIERQRIAQSRWQLMPGFSRVPHPDDPTKSQFKWTFMDPVTGQERYHIQDEAPPGTPEYAMNSFKVMKDQVTKAGLNIPDSTLFNLASGKVDTETDKQAKNSNLWDLMQKDAATNPAGAAILRKKYPGGRLDFLDQMNELDVGKSGYEHLKAIMNGIPWSGQPAVNTQDDKLEKDLLAARKQYNDTFTKADANIEKTRKDTMYADWRGLTSADLKDKTEAKANMDKIDAQLDILNKRREIGKQINQPPQPSPKPQPDFKNPTVPTPKILSQAALEQAAKDHNVSVDVAKSQAIAAGYSIQ